MSYIGVEDVEETLEKALNLGTSLIMPITLVPGKGAFF
jgi:predicted enzyme related to lactoylglutathione lyase